jgi:hypothetical protein
VLFKTFDFGFELIDDQCLVVTSFLEERPRQMPEESELERESVLTRWEEPSLVVIKYCPSKW